MKKQGRRHHLGLTFLYAASIFAIDFLTVVIAEIFAYILVFIGVLDGYGIGKDEAKFLLLFMFGVITVVCLILVTVMGKISMKPINRVVDRIKILASGNYKVRLDFGKPLKDYPVFGELAASFNTLASELESTEMLRSDFINNFSHEFKTPIVSIAGFAKLIRKGNLTEEQKQEYLQIIEEESLRLAAMATNTLNLTKVENQTILTDTSKFNLSEQLRSCVLLLENQWSKKKASWDLDFDEYEITGNEELLKQVWINLLDNAVKFSSNTGEIRVTVKPQENGLCVSVTNFGHEIPKEKQGRIFDKFYQAEESHAATGNGVGLAIVKRVVELHQGQVLVDSSSDKTTFRVILPT